LPLGALVLWEESLSGRDPSDRDEELSRLGFSVNDFPLVIAFCFLFFLLIPGNRRILAGSYSQRLRTCASPW